MRISYLKDFKRGDRLKYIFPNPKINGRNFIFGTVNRIGNDHLEVLDENNLKVNLSSKHLENIEYVERILNIN
jgi:hypothetical protein